MKHLKFLFPVCIGIAFSISISSCKKDDKNSSNSPVPTTKTVISMDSSYNGNVNETQVRYFDYNSSKKLVKVSYKWGTNTSINEYDTVYYNTSGQVSKVERINVNTSSVIETSIFNYTSGILSSVNETGTNNNGPFVRTRNFTYTSGKLSALSVTYTTGSGTGEPEDFTGIVFTGNNMTSADLTGIGNVTVTFETTALNPYYGLNYEPSDFINMFCQNNILKAYVTALPTIVFVDNTYTYSNGRVATIVDASNSPSRTTVLTYTTI